MAVSSNAANVLKQLLSKAKASGSISYLEIVNKANEANIKPEIVKDFCQRLTDMSITIIDGEPADNKDYVELTLTRQSDTEEFLVEVTGGDAPDEIDYESDDTDESEGIQEEINEPSKSHIGLYLQEISRIPAMSAEKERELAIKAKNGSKYARDKLCEANLKLVVSIAQKHSKKGLALSDLIQEGNIGLLQAVNSFDADGDMAFSTYAARLIRQSINQAIANHVREIRINSDMVDKIHKISHARDELKALNNKEPTAEEIADFINLDSERVEQLMSDYMKDILHPHQHDDEHEDDQDESLQEMMNEDDDAALGEAEANQRLSELFKSALDSLEADEAEIIKLHHGLKNGHCSGFEEIGDSLGITAEGAELMYKKAIAKLSGDSGLKKFIE